MTSHRPNGVGADSAGGTARGTVLVAGLLLLGVAAAVTGIWFQRVQTRRCLDFYGPAQARRIAAAPTVELLVLPGAFTRARPTDTENRGQPVNAPVRLAASEEIDVSKAPGLVHLRRGLVEDANFRWESEPAPERLPAGSWDVAFVFTDDERRQKSAASNTSSRSGQGARTVLVLDLDPAGGHLTVVGQPGRIGLGRIGPGLEKWIRSTLASSP